MLPSPPWSPHNSACRAAPPPQAVPSYTMPCACAFPESRYTRPYRQPASENGARFSTRSVRSARAEAHACFEIMQNPLENPRVALRTSPNHDGIAACMLQQIFGILWCEDIAVANDGNLHRRLHFLDDIPIRLAAVILLSGSAMHCHRERCRLHSAIFAISTALMCSSSKPLRNLIVTGFFWLSTRERTIFPTIPAFSSDTSLPRFSRFSAQGIPCSHQ